MFQPTDVQWLELQVSATILAALAGGYLLGIQWFYRSSETPVLRILLSLVIVAFSLIAAVPTELEFPRWVFIFFGILANGALFALVQWFVFRKTMLGGKEFLWSYAGVSTAVQCMFFASLLSVVVDMHWWKFVIVLILAAVTFKGSEVSLRRFSQAKDRKLWYVWHAGIAVVVVIDIIMTVFFT